MKAINHRDGNVYNNDPSNIEIVDVGENRSGITCPSCKGEFPSYPEFTAHIGNPTCANEIIASPTADPRGIIESAGYQYLGEQQRVNQPSCYLFNDETGSTLSLEADEITPEGIRAKVAASREARGLAPLIDEEAICDDIDLILPLVKDLTGYEAQVFVVLNDGRAGLRFRGAAALNLIKNHRKLIDDRERRRFSPFATAKAIIEAETCPDIRAQEDTARLDWLEEFIQTGLIEAAFEMDGGVHLTLSKVGYPASAYREKNSLREAIDEAMKEAD